MSAKAISMRVKCSIDVHRCRRPCAYTLCASHHSHVSAAHRRSRPRANDTGFPAIYSPPEKRKPPEGGFASCVEAQGQSKDDIPLCGEQRQAASNPPRYSLAARHESEQHVARMGAAFEGDAAVDVHDTLIRPYDGRVRDLL